VPVKKLSNEQELLKHVLSTVHNWHKCTCSCLHRLARKRFGADFSEEIGDWTVSEVVYDQQFSMSHSL